MRRSRRFAEELIRIHLDGREHIAVFRAGEGPHVELSLGVDRGNELAVGAETCTLGLRADVEPEEFAGRLGIVKRDLAAIAGRQRDPTFVTEVDDVLSRSDRLQVEWHLNNMPGDALVPPLMLQPLLENAVYHGIEPSNVPGIVSMARGDDPASATTSFFICTGECRALNGKYTAFARVVRGMDVVQAIGSVAVDGETPKEKMTLTRVRIVPPKLP